MVLLAVEAALRYFRKSELGRETSDLLSSKTKFQTEEHPKKVRQRGQPSKIGIRNENARYTSLSLTNANSLVGEVFERNC